MASAAETKVMEPSLYPAQYSGDQQQSGHQFTLPNPAVYGIASQFADVSQLAERDAPDERDNDEDKCPRLKRKRASKACDACRVRKVKCDVSRNPCPQCAEHGIPCLFTTPAKKRGPPNAYIGMQKANMAQQQQQQKPSMGEIHPAALYKYLEVHQSQQVPDSRQYPAQPAMPENFYHTHSPDVGPPSLNRQDLGLEELATPEVLNNIFDDFFTFVYPIAPIILESQFRRKLSKPSEYTNDFLALCASVLAVTIVCLKSSVRNYGSVSFETCLQFSLLRLGFRYRDRINVEITATLEYLALSSSFFGQLTPLENTRSAMFRAEATCAVQDLVYTYLSKGLLNFVDQQLLKRSFIHLQYFHSALALQGRHSRMMRTTFTTADIPLEKMMPLDLADSEIENISDAGDEKAQVAGQFANLLAPSVKSYVPALVLLHGLYKLFEESYEVRNNENLALVVRLAGMYKNLLEVRHYLDKIPVQLRWTENNKVHGIGFEVQKANLYVARMHLSSALLDKCHMLTLRSPGASSGLDLEKERRLVISETLRIIKTIPRQALEGNGRAMVKRVRQIASTLTDVIQSQNGTSYNDAQDELNQFVTILNDLDPSAPSNSLGQTSSNMSGSFNQDEGCRISGISRM